MRTTNLLEFAIRAAQKAGEEILKVYESDFAVEKKEDNSPLTLADKNAHKIITLLLSETHIPVLSEEGGDIPYSERKGWKTLWMVDPLDGTKEFVKRNGEFTVNIALIEDQKPILGVIFSPVKKIMYYAEQGLGAFRIDTGGSTDVIDMTHAIKLPFYNGRKTYIVVASRSHMTEETIKFIDEKKKIHNKVEIISAGSALKICLVAEGSADVYPRFGPTMEWDTAAGQAIAKNAGKKLIDAKTNQPMIYNRENLRNNSFIVQ